MLLAFAAISIALSSATYARGAPSREKQIAQHVVMVNASVRTEQDLTATSGTLIISDRFAGDVTADLITKHIYTANDESSGAINTMSPQPAIVLLA